MSDAMMAETVHIPGAGGDSIEAYLARPLGKESHGSVVVIHHMPGYDEPTKEITRRFAANGYAAICPNLYWREAPGASHDDAAAAARAAGGVPDERLIGDIDGAGRYLRSLATSNGRVGVIGYCSGGRQTVLAACNLDLDAAVDCYGAFAFFEPPEGAPVSFRPLASSLPNLSCPLLGLFGTEDKYPGPDETAAFEKELARLGKTFEFHTYEGAGHAFFSVDRPSYRPEAATDGWQRIFNWFGQYLS